MCGITAISANKEALPFLLQGLEKLEYRGYDSAGITTIEGKSFEVIHKLLGKEKFCDKIIHQPVKLNFFEYIERMYKNTNYRTTDDRNKYIPLEFKKPTSLEDQYIFYFRYIDLYMGDYLKQKTGKV